MKEKVIVWIVTLVLVVALLVVGVVADYYGTKYTCWKAQQAGGQCVVVHQSGGSSHR